MDPAAPFDDPTAGAAAVGTGTASPLDRGDVVNLMAELRGRLEASEELAKITDVQNRLVMQRLEDAGTWKRPRAALEEQIQRIAKTIASVTALEEETVEKALRACA